ncbi:PAS domain-containing sensor histidine kinase [Pandoraea faecigallinarum]|uniref:PAS domain-containing hybrid sensor histidine kinase/response regulator n=1 Tax=Pandoraea faecigallinarum TaxID=656179 RepID=UPI0012F4D49C|nr:PAS domain-containing sensor histidine kinase [Pandoraea faecigallinarum]
MNSKFRAGRWTLILLSAVMVWGLDLWLRHRAPHGVAQLSGWLYFPVIALAAYSFGRYGNNDDKGDDGGEDAEGAPGGARHAQRVLEAMPNATFSVDTELRITQWNPAAERMFGVPAEHAIGQCAQRFIARHWLSRHPLRLPRNVDAARATAVDVVCLRADGRPFRATFSSAPLRDDTGKCVGATVLLRDESARHLDNRRIRQSLRGARDERDQADTSNRLKDELLATVSHELRTPLNAIYGWVEVLRHPSGQPMQSQAVDAIDRSARSLAHMVDDILDVSSLATGKLRLERVLVDVERIVHDVTVTMQTMANAEGVTLTSSMSATTGLLLGDGERLRQMLTNLVSNAIKFTPRGGHVSVSLEQDAHWLRLSVIDSGQGIAPEFLPHVFDAFRRESNAPVSPRRGLGLGLSIVRHIAELHGGSVEVASRGAGTGSRFTVRLPYDRPVAAGVPSDAVPGPTHPSTVLEGHRILLVDDDDPSRESLAAALRTLGAEVHEAGNGREALDALGETMPTIVLSDLAMPDGDGFWLARQLREIRAARGGMANLPLVAVTARADNALRRQALSAGFGAYVAKPVDLRSLARQILTLTSQ